jgi:hypothetical protein
VKKGSNTRREKTNGKTSQKRRRGRPSLSLDAHLRHGNYRPCRHGERRPVATTAPPAAPTEEHWRLRRLYPWSLELVLGARPPLTRPEWDEICATCKRSGGPPPEPPTDEEIAKRVAFCEAKGIDHGWTR